ncbi:hypothetical protein E4T44_03711, partial [Aureobasidium sp. EXF-8845]
MANLDLVPFAGYISDDSDFLGSVRVRKKLQARGKETSTKQLAQRWNEGQAAHPIAPLSTTSSDTVPQTLYNRLEGISTARQLTETVDEFLKRLPPRTTNNASWIWITCPVLEGKGKTAESRHPPELKESPEQLMDRANALLSQFAVEKERIASANPDSAQSTITRKLGPLREQLKEDILDLAVASG